MNGKVLFDEDGWNRLLAEVPKVTIYYNLNENYFLMLSCHCSDEISYAFRPSRALKNQRISCSCCLQVPGRWGKDRGCRSPPFSEDLYKGYREIKNSFWCRNSCILFLFRRVMVEVYISDILTNLVHIILSIRTHYIYTMLRVFIWTSYDLRSDRL